MGARISNPGAPFLLFLEEKNNDTFSFASEFKKLVPQWEIVRVHERLSAMRCLTDATAPQAFVIDLAMMDNAGVELLEWVKLQPHYRRLPLVVLSNSDDLSQRQRCVALGVSSYLDRPKSPKELRNNIRYIVKLCEGPRFHSNECEEMACV
jgi:CheY-like chemotaxis protein